MKVYVTKYALTKGIEVKDVSPADDSGYVCERQDYDYRRGQYYPSFVLGKTAFHTYEEAVLAAREMRDKKKVSLKKQLDKVNNLLFPSKMPTLCGRLMMPHPVSGGNGTN